MNKVIDEYKRALWIKCPKCGVYFHPLHTYHTDGIHCTYCSRIIESEKERNKSCS